MSEMPRTWWSPSRGWFGEVGRETFALVPDYDGPGELPGDAVELFEAKASAASEETDREALIEKGAEWLHSWSGSIVCHPWTDVGPARKARLRHQVAGLLNIIDHGTPGEVADDV